MRYKQASRHPFRTTCCEGHTAPIPGAQDLTSQGRRSSKRPLTIIGTCSRTLTRESRQARTGMETALPNIPCWLSKAAASSMKASPKRSSLVGVVSCCRQPKPTLQGSSSQCGSRQRASRIGYSFHAPVPFHESRRAERYPCTHELAGAARTKMLLPR